MKNLKCKIKNLSVIFGLCLLYFTLFILNCSLYAGIIVEPVRQEISVKPGQTFKGKYTVKNPDDKKVEINISARQWVKTGINKDITIDNWLKISPTTIELAPQEKKEIKYEVFLPTSTVGEVSAMISFVPEAKKNQMLNLVLSVSLYVTAKGTEVIDAKISDISLHQEKAKNLKVAVIVKNKGNVHIRPEGSVIIKKGRKTLNTINLRSGWPVYPDRKYGYIGTWANANLKKGKYTAYAHITYGDKLSLTKKKVFRIDKNGRVVKNRGKL